MRYLILVLFLMGCAERVDNMRVAIDAGVHVIEKSAANPATIKWLIKAVNKTNGTLCYHYTAIGRDGWWMSEYVVITTKGAYKDVITYLENCPDSADYAYY